MRRYCTMHVTCPQLDCPNFEYMLWFESLLFYNCEEQSEMQKDDVDVGLLPAIVEKVILPKLAGEQSVEAVWSVPTS